MSDGSDVWGDDGRGVGRGAGRGTGDASAGVRKGSGFGVEGVGLGVFAGSAFSIRLGFGVSFSDSAFFFGEEDFSASNF
jgi:hypothetical protein